MRHRLKLSKIGTSVSQRKAMIRNLVTSLVVNDRIETTSARAKAIQPVVEKMISFVQKHEPKIAIRKVNTIVFTKEASKKVMHDLKDRYKDRKSGFTRIKMVGERAGDNAPKVIIEFV